ncbi:MAG: sensor histidine kinase, partial [Actinomycetes bacterium]
MTLSAVVLTMIGVALIGGIIGLRIGRRPPRVDTRRAPHGLTVADLVQRVVLSSHNCVVLINRVGDVVLHNPPAAQLGLVRGQRPDERAWKAAQQVLASGEVVHVDLSPLEQGARAGRGPTAVLGEVRPLGDGFTVVDASDESDAVRLEATRRDFVANVSHELKTPVGAVALLAEAVLNAADDPEAVRRFSTKILNESTRLGALVTELIALSRLQGAERLPELATVEVDEVVREALDRCRLAAESANIRITVDPPSGLLLDGDATLLITALSNL